MAENLRSTKFNTGKEIPLLTNEQWMNSTAPGIINKNAEGNFYNFYTLASEENVCPQGFHVPNHKDISKLYNQITPYSDHLKIKGNTVKQRNYSPALIPITYPLFSAIHLAWWATAASIDAGLLSLAVASDAVLYTSELITSPILGWETRKKQYQENLSKSLKYKYIDVNGRALSFDKYDSTFKFSNLNPIHPKDWSNFKIVELIITPNGIENGYQGAVITNVQKIDSLKNGYTPHKYNVKFNPFYFRWSTTAWFAQSDYFSEWNGMFGAFNFAAYRNVIHDDIYLSEGRGQGYQTSLGYFNYQPVISTLFNKGNNEFADQYGFNLNQNNTLLSLTSKNGKGRNSQMKIIDNNCMGISYLDGYYLPGFFGIIKNLNQAKKSKGKGGNITNPMAHELNILEESSDVIDEVILMKTQTRIRCVKD
jgi:hypothetical protein